MRDILKRLLKKPVILTVYDFFLVNDKEVVDKCPELIRSLADDFNLELYVVKLKDGGEYAKAIIKIYINDARFFFKYDTGRVNGDYKAMLDDCEAYIKSVWGLDHFRQQAKMEADKLGWLDKKLYL